MADIDINEIIENIKSSFSENFDNINQQISSIKEFSQNSDQNLQNIIKDVYNVILSNKKNIDSTNQQVNDLNVNVGQNFTKLESTNDLLKRSISLQNDISNRLFAVNSAINNINNNINFIMQTMMGNDTYIIRQLKMLRGVYVGGQETAERERRTVSGGGPLSSNRDRLGLRSAGAIALGAGGLIGAAGAGAGAGAIFGGGGGSPDATKAEDFPGGKRTDPNQYQDPGKTGGQGDSIDPVQLAQSARFKIANSQLNGKVPSWGAKFGITQGSPEEWARFIVMLMRQESGLKKAKVNPDGSLQKFKSTPSGEKSYGPGQFNIGEYGLKTWADVNDPDKVLDAIIKVIEKGKLFQYFGPMKRGGGEVLVHGSWYDKNVAPKVNTPSTAGGGTQLGGKSDPGGLPTPSGGGASIGTPSGGGLPTPSGGGLPTPSGGGASSGTPSTSFGQNIFSQNANTDAVKLASSMINATRKESLQYLAKGGFVNKGEAWCAQFVNSTLKQSGISGTNSAVANSFQNWGISIKAQDVKAGDVVLLTRGKGPNQVGGHVGIATGNVQDGKIEMIAGNTGGKVKKYFVPVDSKLMIKRALDGKSSDQSQTKDSKSSEIQGAISSERSGSQTGAGGITGGQGMFGGLGSILGMIPGAGKFAPLLGLVEGLAGGLSGGMQTALAKTPVSSSLDESKPTASLMPKQQNTNDLYGSVFDKLTNFPSATQESVDNLAKLIKSGFDENMKTLLDNARLSNNGNVKSDSENFDRHPSWAYAENVFPTSNKHRLRRDSDLWNDVWGGHPS